jgi:hypothetical protein
MNSINQTDPILLEQLRQERETFDEHKKQSQRWFNLRFIMGILAIIMLPSLLIIAAYVLYYNSNFSEWIIRIVASTLFVDAIAFLISIWKILLKGDFISPLSPITKVSTMTHTFNTLQNNKLIILTARYGAKDCYIDVTKRLQDKIINNTIDILITNENMGDDPIIGTRKVIELTYVLNELTKSTTIQENHLLKLP